MTEQRWPQLCFNYHVVSFLKLTLCPVIFAVGMSSIAQAQMPIDHNELIQVDL